MRGPIMRGPIVRGPIVRGNWGAWSARSGALLAAVVLGYFVGILSPGWVRAQPSGGWVNGGQLSATDLNTLVRRVTDLESRANTPRLSAPDPIAQLRANDPITFPEITSAALVVFSPGGGGVGGVTFDVSLGTAGRLVRMSTGGDTAMLPVPAGTPFTVTPALGAGASPALNIVRFTLN